VGSEKVASEASRENFGFSQPSATTVYSKKGEISDLLRPSPRTEFVMYRGTRTLVEHWIQEE
jgi:hypothetical protein